MAIPVEDTGVQQQSFPVDQVAKEPKRINPQPSMPEPRVAGNKIPNGDC